MGRILIITLVSSPKHLRKDMQHSVSVHISFSNSFLGTVIKVMSHIPIPIFTNNLVNLRNPSKCNQSFDSIEFENYREYICTRTTDTQ